MLLLPCHPCYGWAVPSTSFLSYTSFVMVVHTVREITNTSLIPMDGALEIISTEDELASLFLKPGMHSSPVLAIGTLGLLVFWMLGLNFCFFCLLCFWPQTPCYVISFHGFEVFRLRWSNAPYILGSLQPTGNLLCDFSASIIV